MKAKMKYLRVSPRKARLVAQNIVSLPVDTAINILKMTPNKAAKVLHDVLWSAYSNAVQNFKDVRDESLYVKEIVVNEGPMWKRFMPRAQGRATKIRKRTSHITVILAEGQD